MFSKFSILHYGVRDIWNVPFQIFIDFVHYKPLANWSYSSNIFCVKMEIWGNTKIRHKILLSRFGNIFICYTYCHTLSTRFCGKFILFWQQYNAGGHKTVACGNKKKFVESCSETLIAFLATKGLNPIKCWGGKERSSARTEKLISR